MEIALLVVIGLFSALLCLFTAISWVIKALGRVVARGREVRPQTRYFVG